MSSAAERAFRDLIAANVVGGASLLEPDGKLGDMVFTCDLPVPFPNAEGLPPRAPVRVGIPAQFPQAKVEFFCLDPSFHGFAHQDARTGALCLKPGKAYPSEASARLLAYLESAIEWLADAAHGELLTPRQPWELPDFRTNRKDRPPEVLPLEDASTFAAWENRVGEYGTVQMAAHAHDRGLVPVRFERNSLTILEPQVSEGFLNRKGGILGTWVLLDSAIVFRHRPARVFRELEAQCTRLGVDLWKLLRRTVRGETYKGYHYLLVGAPIPRKVGDPPTRIHWQPIALTAASVDALRGGGKKRRPATSSEERSLRSRLSGAFRDQGIPWSDATAYPQDRAEARGSLSEPVKRARVCVLGCGALGSLVAEHLARGGARELSLFDNEVLDLDNLSRHALSAVEVGQNKAVAHARRLNGIHPRAHVRGFAFSLPPRPAPGKADRPAWDLLQQADVLIDCTADQSVFGWASALGRENGKLVVHMFLNAHATMLTLCVSGRHASCAKVTRRLFDDIGAARTGFTVEEHDPEVEEILPGAGCWHATFPALGSDIAALVASSVPILEGFVARAQASAGTAIVLRRHEFAFSSGLPPVPTNIVDIAWAANYR
jgi:hypothetical protein